MESTDAHKNGKVYVLEKPEALAFFLLFCFEALAFTFLLWLVLEVVVASKNWPTKAR